MKGVSGSNICKECSLYKGNKTDLLSKWVSIILDSNFKDYAIIDFDKLIRKIDCPTPENNEDLRTKRLNLF
jgi:hypothetical protein